MAVRRSYDFERDGWNATIKVDYDGEIPFEKVQEAGEYLQKRKLAISNIEVSRTRKGHHLRIWLKQEIGPYTTLRLQSMLGDDAERQKFNRIRVRKRKHGWNVLFNAKYRGKSARMKEIPDELQTSLVWKQIMSERKETVLERRIETMLRRTGNGKR
jgi:hypothetical protein